MDNLNMRTNPNPHLHTPPPGARSEHAAKPQLRFKTEDFEKTIDFLPRHKQNYARSLFPKDHTGRWMKTDERRMAAFMRILDPHERKTLGRALGDNRMSINPGRMSDAETAKLKDSGRFVPEPAPPARRPAQGADLDAPFGFQAAHPQGMEEDPHRAPSGSAQGKPGPGSPKPQRVTLADLFAADKPGRDSSVPPSHQDKPHPPKGILKKEAEAGTPKGKPDAGSPKPNRVRFADKAEVREYPKGEDYEPGHLSPGSLQDMPKPPGGQNHETPPIAEGDGRKPVSGLVSKTVGGALLAAGTVVALTLATEMGSSGGDGQ